MGGVGDAQGVGPPATHCPDCGDPICTAGGPEECPSPNICHGHTDAERAELELARLRAEVERLRERVGWAVMFRGDDFRACRNEVPPTERWSMRVWSGSEWTYLDGTGRKFYSERFAFLSLDAAFAALSAWRAKEGK